MDTFEVIEPTQFLPSLAITFEGTLIEPPSEPPSPRRRHSPSSPRPILRSPLSSSPSPAVVEKGALKTTKTHIWLCLPALSLLLTLRSTSTSAHRSRHKAQFPPSSTPLNVSSLLRCSTAGTGQEKQIYIVSALADTKVDLKVLSQRLGLGKGGLRMAPEEAIGEKLQ
ncbi:hypothetical protein PIB30_068423, partial [Stylosanthes scabra]|nr:hypothetical protein [Stylosanthes scabra]